MDKFRRLSPNGLLVFADLKNGEMASFVTPDVMSKYVDFEVQSVKVQSKPLTSFQDEGEIEEGVLISRPEDVYAELSGLPRNFRLKILWSGAKVLGQYQKLPKNEIAPFQHVNHLGPGVSTYQDLIGLLGPPGQVKESSRMLFYKERGMTFRLVEKNIRPLSVIESIMVESPFDGKTPEGLYIGLSKEAATKIVEVNFRKKEFYGDVVYVGRPGSEKACFEVVFADGKITRMTFEACN